MPIVEKNKVSALLAVATVQAPALKVPWTYSTATMVPEMALYYGFLPLEHVLRHARLEKQDEHLANELADRPGALFSVREKIGLLRQHFAKNPGGAPLAVFSEHSAGRTNRSVAEYHLDIIGSAWPTAEALLMKLCYEVAREQDAASAMLEINSVGERESFSRFSRDAAAHFRKHLETMHADCRQAFKKNVFAAINCQHAECQPARESMPDSISFLSEPSRNHFMGVLEHLEAAGVPYALDKELIVEPDIVQHSIFRVSIAGQPESVIIARGGRWGGLGRRMGFKKDVLGASAIIQVPKRKAAATTGGKPNKKMRQPVFYFIHIGHDALLRSLNVIEDLRRAKIAVYHALLKDKMAAQLGTAEHLGVPYILIMGQKESVDGTAVVREMLTRSQETIPLGRLADYLRTLQH